MDFNEINKVNLNNISPQKKEKKKPANENPKQQRENLKEIPNNPSYWQNTIGVKNSTVSFSGTTGINNEFIDKQIANIKRTCYWGEDARTNDSFHRQAMQELYSKGEDVVEKYTNAVILGLQSLYQEKQIEQYNKILLDVFKETPDIKDYGVNTLSYVLQNIVETKADDIDKYKDILFGLLHNPKGMPSEKLSYMRKILAIESKNEHSQSPNADDILKEFNTYVELCEFISDEDCKKNILKSKLTVEDEKNLIKLIKDDSVPADSFIDFIRNNVEPTYWLPEPEVKLMEVVNEISSDDRKKNLFIKLIDKKTSYVQFGANTIQEVFEKDIEFITKILEYVHSRRIEENSQVSTSFIDMLNFFDNIDSSNFKDFIEFSKEDSIENAIINTELYKNPKTDLFDKSIYDKKKEFETRGIDDFNSLSLAFSCIDMKTGKFSKIALDIIDILYPSNNTGLKSQITSLKSRLKTASKIKVGNWEWYLNDIIGALKNNNGEFEEKNKKFLYSLIRANRKRNKYRRLDFIPIISILNSVKNEKGVVDSKKAVSAMNILIGTKEYSATANILKSLMKFPENKRGNIFQICKNISPNEKNCMLNLGVFAEYCFDKNGNLDENKLEYVKKLVSSNEIIFDNTFFNLCDEYPQLQDFYAQIVSNVNFASSLHSLGTLTKEFLDENDTISEKTQNLILDYVKATKDTYGFQNLYKACYQKINGKYEFNQELYDRAIKLLKYDHQLSPYMYSSNITGKRCVDILKQELSISDVKFNEKVSLLNSLKKIRDYAQQINPKEFECLNKAISDIEASLTLENISLPINETAKTDFIKNVFTSKTSNTELTEFETAIINAIPKLEEMTNGIRLTYPRENFLEDLSIICDTDEKIQILTQKAGMHPIFDEEDGKTITGYNGIIKLNELDKNNTVENEIYNCLYNFMYNNEANTGDKELDRQLNYIIKAFPEFINTVGKKQHGTQKYTVDVHSLLVLAYSIQNPDYLNNLNALDRSLLKISAIFHDLMKQENIVDKGHQNLSSLYARSIVKKLIQNPETQDRIYELIDNHHWTEEYSYATDRSKKSKELAFRFRRPNDFEIAKIMARSDLKAVNSEFYERLKGCLDKSNLEPIQENIDYLYSTGSAIFSDKISKNAKLDNCTEVKGGTEYKVINLHEISDNADMGEYGFEKGKRKNDLKFLVHMVNSDSLIYESLNTIKLLSSPLNGGVLSESLITPEYKRTYSNRKYGVLLSEINTNIVNVANSNQGSGTQKDITNIIDLIYGGYCASYRTNFKEELLKNLIIPQDSITDEEYAQFYKEVIAAKTSLSEINKSKKYKLGKYTITGEQLYHAINKFQDNLIDKNEKMHNEIVGYTPKISAVIAKANSLNALPDGLLKFAHENNLPIILL